ncbi:unnamed protein product [Mytilus coruscus]|uniref:Immunoglobulin domain-containing protein n=1 Tax=Mytilus coruscus TaxID=42192 RepID=A0A6J8DVY7_MYTCO|nr:unnamed protein product [Mytilus coruscus]
MSFAYLFAIFAVNSITKVFAIYAVKGSTGQLVCPYTSTNSLRWSFKSTTASSYTSYTSNDRISPNLPPELIQRLSVTGNHAIGEYHLKISNIQESDQGIYQCIDFTVQSYTQDLIVIVGPTNITIENVTPNSRIPGIEGQDMTIKCTATGGQPAPDIKLIILGSPYTGKQSVQHTFKPLGTNDGSNVTCLAGYQEINSYPLSTSANIHLMRKYTTSIAGHEAIEDMYRHLTIFAYIHLKFMKIYVLRIMQDTK